MRYEIFELADEILKEMIKNPLVGYGPDNKMVNAADDDIKNAFAILKSRGYVEYPTNAKTGKPVEISLLVTNKGGDFILAGGFKEQIERERLIKEEIIATFQKRTTIITIGIAALTLLALLFQLIAQKCHIHNNCLGKNVSISRCCNSTSRNSRNSFLSIT